MRHAFCSVAYFRRSYKRAGRLGGAIIATFSVTNRDSRSHNNGIIHSMGWLRLVGSLKSEVSTAKEPYKRDYILQKRPVILRSLHIVATP